MTPRRVSAYITTSLMNSFFPGTVITHQGPAMLIPLPQIASHWCQKRGFQTLNTLLHQTRKLSLSSEEGPKLESIAKGLRTGSLNQVLVVAGAGVSCAAGIPDFRTPGSGLYDNLDRFNLPYPEAVFDLDYFMRDPMPFITLAKDLWPGVKYRPTLTHCFFNLLDKKGLLRRIYTQNIDGLEALAGVNPLKLIECHGTFRSASCILCQTKYDMEVCKHKMLENSEVPLCETCGGFVKPDIVFFGEVMPSRFFELIDNDVASADLIIVLGTSLNVAPVANIPDWVDSNCIRLLINREIVGNFYSNRKTDVILLGDCDDGVGRLCQLAGWNDELDLMFRQY